MNNRPSLAVAGVLVVLVLVFGTLTVTALNTISAVSRETRDAQECIIGTLLFTPATRAATPGAVLDEVCGFDEGTIDRFRAEHDIEIPKPETENQ